MKKIKSLLLLASAVTALNVAMPQVHAQGGPRSPEEFRQMQLDRLKESLGVTKDDEWKIISERAEAVMKAQSATMGFRARFGGPGGPGGRRGGGNGGDNGGGNGGGQGRRGGFGGFGEQAQEVKDLQSAIEAKAPADEIKAKLEKLRAARKSKEADVTKAQDKLKEVLDSRQEAIAVMAGLLQ